MRLETWWLFCAVVFVLSATPGPNMLHVLTRSVAVGVRRGTAAMAGCGAAVLTALIASAAGLAAVLTAFPLLFEVIRYAGAAYLAWLGVRAWMERGAAPDETAEGGGSGRVSLAALFRGGYLVGITNPKLLLFAAAFLPQFIDPARPQGRQFVILIATFGVIEMFWYGVYGLGGQTLARWLKGQKVRTLFNRLTGTLFFGFGLMLVRARLD